MKVILSEKTDLNDLIEKVNNEKDSYIITDKDGKSIIALSLDEYESMMETMYSLSSKANAEHLLKSIKEYETGEINSFTMEELLNLEK
jgi:antitoxin YefM